MENQRNHTIAQQAEELFHFYDRAGIGFISKTAMLSYFELIDKMITEEWISKILIAQGISLGEFINCQQFVEIMTILSLIPEQDDFSEGED